MNELTTTGAQPPAFQGRAVATGGINVGAVAIETERAIAEAQGKLTLAKRFPRDLNAAHADLMAACKSKAFAAVAFYAKPQGGSTVTGPSIRLAEQVAQVYGNFDYGHRELSRDDRKSEIEVYAWDMQNNNYTRRQKTVMHVIDTREGPKKMRDQTQVDQKINNVASKEMRGLILAMMPKWLVEDAIQECKKTIAGTNDEPLDVRVRKMTQAFAKFGVKAVHLEKHLGHSLDNVLLDELVELTGIYNALKDGEPASELFPSSDVPVDDAPAPAAAAIANAAKKPAATTAATSNSAKSRTAASKPVESTSKPVKDDVSGTEQKTPEAAQAADPEAASPASQKPASVEDEANAAAAAAGEEPDVF
jgi:hypothetical protein